MPGHKDLLQKYCANSPAGFAIELHSTPEHPNPIAIKIKKAGLAFWEGDLPAAIHIFMPMNIKKETIENVFDLRQRKRNNGLMNFCRKVIKTFPRWLINLVPLKRCYRLLAFITGAAVILQMRLGAYLRVKGANGMVFPSARCDVKCEFYNGRLNDYKGWNFVDYRQLQRPFGDTFIDVSPWINYVGEGITIASAPDDSPYAHSWRIDGKEAWEDSNRAQWLKDFYDGKKEIKLIQYSCATSLRALTTILLSFFKNNKLSMMICL